MVDRSVFKLRFDHPGRDPSSLRGRRLRLPYIPLPYTIHAVGLSRLSRTRNGVRWTKIRSLVYDRRGESCFYCGAPPDSSRRHDCHEVFAIEPKTATIRLVAIVPACHSCHEWADGRPFVHGSLGRYLYMTYSQLRTELKLSKSDPDWSRMYAVQQYQASRHFRRVNRISIREMKTYLTQAWREHLRHNRIRRQWRVDYGPWADMAGFAPGEVYTPPRKSRKGLPASRFRIE